MSNYTIRLCIITLSAVLLTTLAPAHARLLSGPDIIAAPLSVQDDHPGAENDHQQAFNERQSVLLSSDLQVDGGSIIPAGTTVNSHMIFLNSEGRTRVSDLDVRWSFDGPILGVLSDINGNLEAASNAILGGTKTFYPGAFPNRGLETNDGYSVSGSFITVSMTVTEPGDWIRVVSAVPVPAAVWLFGSALVGLLGLTRRRRG